jgi:hypothetical protein
MIFKSIAMKKRSIFFNTILLFFAALLFSSCSKTSNNKNSQETQRLKELVVDPESYNVIGQTHNEGLDYIFKETFEKNLQTTYVDVNDASVNYVFTKNPMTNKSKDDKSFFFKDEFRQLIKNAVYSNSIIASKEILLKKLTTEQYKIIEDLDKIVTSNNLSLKEKIKQIANIESLAIKQLGDNEIVYVLCATNLAKHSLEYWDSNKSRWISRINEINAVKGSNIALKIDYHNVAVADIGAFLLAFPAGAQAGALVGALALGIETFGTATAVGAVLGAIIGGTGTGTVAAITASSVVLAAEMILDWF